MIKDDLQFILENKSNAKLKERLLENSFNGSNYNSNYNNNNNNNIINESDLNNSVISTQSKGKIRSRYNLKEKMDGKNLTKFQEFLNTYNQKKNVLLLVDSKNTVWELLKRPDLSIANLSTMENISSLSTALNVNSKNNYGNNCNDNNFNSDGKSLKNNIYLNNSNLVDEKLLNIEIKENEDKSFANSELDISKNTDFNISALIRDTQNNDNISDIN